MKRRLRRITSNRGAVPLKIGGWSFAVVVALALTMLPQARQNVEGQFTVFPQGAKMANGVPLNEWVPAGRPDLHEGWMNGYVRGLELVLRRKGHEVDYTTLMGDIGQAFIMQAESSNKIDGAVDAGWWPLQPMGIMRLSFVEKAVGCRIADVMLPVEEYPNMRKDPRDVYRRIFEPTILSTLNRQEPCVAVWWGDADYIITAVDDGQSVRGMCPNEKAGEERVYPIEVKQPPLGLLTTGENMTALDRAKADREALRFAVALHHDRVLDPANGYEGPYSLRGVRDLTRFGWTTGRKSFTTWIACLEDTVHPGQARWHANVKKFLIRNRTTAVRYLQAMSERHGEPSVAHLNTAIIAYERVVAQARAMDVSGTAMKAAEGRMELVAAIRAVRDLEEEAVSALENAIASM